MSKDFESYKKESLTGMTRNNLNSTKLFKLS